MHLSIVILNYNTPVHTVNCIKSLYKYYKNEIRSRKYEIILIDNKSTDNSVIRIQKEIKKRNWKILFIKSNKNNGFGSGCNTGAKRSKGEFILFLNSDTLVRDKSLSRMTKFMAEHSNIAILGGNLFYEDGTTQGACGVSPNLYHSLMILLGLGKDILVRAPSKVEKVDWVLGACMLIRKSVFKKLKGFDRKIFMYFEEVELCFRAKKNGFDVVYYPFAQITHLEGKSSSSNFRTTYSYKGYLYFYKKHKNRFEYILVKSLFSIKFKVYELYGKLIGDLDFSNTYSRI